MPGRSFIFADTAARRSAGGAEELVGRSSAAIGRSAGAIGAAIRERRDDLVALTQALIRIPTRQPAGRRLPRDLRAGRGPPGARAASRPSSSAPRARPATATAIRAGTSSPGARARGRAPCVHFNSHHRRGRGRAAAGPSIRSAASCSDGRIYGRGTCDMKGGLATSIIAVEAFLDARARTSPARSRSRHRRRGDRRLRRRRLAGRAGLFLARAASTTSSSPSR